jgi:hypothetical protein
MSTVSTQQRISGVYQGTVVNNTDPMGQSRIQVLIPNLPPYDTTPSSWATPAIPAYSTGPHPAPPAIGELTWIIFAGGDPTAPMWFPLNTYPGIVPGPAGATGAPGPAGPPGHDAAQPVTSYPFAIPGPLQNMHGTVRLGIPIHGTILTTLTTVNTPSQGSSIIADVLKNSTSIFLPANRPTLPAGLQKIQVVPDVTSLAAGDYLTVDLVQVGSTVRGSDLCLVVAVAHS